MALRIEKSTDCTNVNWGYFFEIYKDDEYLGTVLLGNGTPTAEECYEELKNSWAIDEMERQHYSDLNRLEL